MQANSITFLGSSMVDLRGANEHRSTLQSYLHPQIAYYSYIHKLTYHITHRLKSQYTRTPPLQQVILIPVELARKRILDSRCLVPVMTLVRVERKLCAWRHLGELLQEAADYGRGNNPVS